MRIGKTGMRTNSSVPSGASPPAAGSARIGGAGISVLDAWLSSHLGLIALLALAGGFLLRAKIAAANFLNPDEALHYLLANQPSAMMAYKASLTNAHPPLFVMLLYFWRSLAHSEFFLRLPSVLAGVALGWVVFKWLGNLFGKAAGVIGLILITFSPATISLSAEVRHYALLLLFMACGMYFLDRAFEEKSGGKMLLFSIFLYLAILTHYSAFLFTLAIGVYSLVRILGRRLPAKVVMVWSGVQTGALLLYAFLYATHISKLKSSPLAEEAFGGWLRLSYFHPGKDNLLVFPLLRTGGVFAYIFGQPVVGATLFLLFFAGVPILLAKGVLRGQSKFSSSDLSILLALPFVINCGAAIAGVYPYGWTRHSVFLALFVTAGVSLVLSRLGGRKLWPGLVAAVIVVAACNLFENPPGQRILLRDQSQALMRSAVDYIRRSVSPGGMIFVDYQTSLLLGYYLGRDQVIPYDAPQGDFLEYPYGGYRVVSSRRWSYDLESFGTEFIRMKRVYRVEPAAQLLVVQGGWGPNIYTELTRQYRGTFLSGLRFGENLSVFKVPVRLYSLRQDLNPRTGELQPQLDGHAQSTSPARGKVSRRLSVSATPPQQGMPGKAAEWNILPAAQRSEPGKWEQLAEDGRNEIP